MLIYMFLYFFFFYLSYLVDPEAWLCSGLSSPNSLSFLSLGRFLFISQNIYQVELELYIHYYIILEDT